MSNDETFTYRWYMLALSVVTATFVVTVPFSCMPSLFKEMSDDLDLSLVQIGTVWGMSNLAGIFISLAVVHPGLPFLFWAALSAAAIFCLAPIRERSYF